MSSAMISAKSAASQLVSKRVLAELEASEWTGISLPAESRDVPRVLIMGVDEAESLWGEAEKDARGCPIYPLLVTNSPSNARFASPFLRLAPFVVSTDEDLLIAEVKRLLGCAGRLHSELVTLDSSAELLVQNALCEWVKCNIGVIGRFYVAGNPGARELSVQLSELVEIAHRTVDSVPATRLTADELWTLLLVASVPWPRELLNPNAGKHSVGDEEDIARTLRVFTSNTKGSRKIVLHADEGVAELIGPVGTSQAAVTELVTVDPLRDELRALAVDDEELETLQLMFKRRFSADDVDALIGVLGRRID